MTPAETIQAAIDKLTQLRDKSTPGAWKRSGSYVEEADPANPDDRFDVLPLTIFRIEESDQDADLVVTLHATIDAQLAIMQRASEKAAGPYSLLEQATTERLLSGPLSLARAIVEAGS